MHSVLKCIYIILPCAFKFLQLVPKDVCVCVVLLLFYFIFYFERHNVVTEYVDLRTALGKSIGYSHTHTHTYIYLNQSLLFYHLNFNQ